MYRYGTQVRHTGVLDALYSGARLKGYVQVATRPLIAVVDDDRIYTEMIRDFLDGEGYDTILIQEAATAVEAIASAKPALALLDVRMDAAESGVEILSDLRDNPQTTYLPVIVCTADQQFLRNRSAFLQSQNAAFVAKPFDLDTLLEVIVRTLATPP